MEKRKVTWYSVWLLSFLIVFCICIFLRSSTLAGFFVLAGIIIAAIAQIVFGSATWASVPYSTGYTRGVHPAMLSSTVMKEIGKERYMQEEKTTEWTFGFGLTIIGFLLFLAGLLASVYLRFS